jgi:hypothetical protein
VNAERAVLSLPAAIERFAETVRQSDGLPFVDFTITKTAVSGEPLVIVESLDHGYDWANFLRINLLQLNIPKGEVEFRGYVNGVLWSVLVLPDEPVPFIPVDWDGPAHQTQLVPVVEAR